MTDDRRQTAEDRDGRQKTEDRRQKTEDGRQRTEGGLAMVSEQSHKRKPPVENTWG